MHRADSLRRNAGGLRDQSLLRPGETAVQADPFAGHAAIEVTPQQHQLARAASGAVLDQGRSSHTYLFGSERRPLSEEPTKWLQRAIPWARSLSRARELDHPDRRRANNRGASGASAGVPSIASSSLDWLGPNEPSSPSQGVIPKLARNARSSG